MDPPEIGHTPSCQPEAIQPDPIIQPEDIYPAVNNHGQMTTRTHNEVSHTWTELTGNMRNNKYPNAD